MANPMLSVAAKSAVGDNSALRPWIDKLSYSQNVGDRERVISAVTGLALIARGIAARQISPTSIIAGAALALRGATGHCHLYQALGFSTAPTTGPSTIIPPDAGTRIEAAVMVHKPARELYQFWRDLSQMPRFLTPVKSIEDLGGQRSRWTMAGPLGITVTWDAIITKDTKDETIAWESLPDSDLDTVGSVDFRPVSNASATEVRVNLKFDPPGGRAGKFLAQLLGPDPQQQLEQNLQAFKEMMESSLIVKTQKPSFARR